MEDHGLRGIQNVAMGDHLVVTHRFDLLAMPRAFECLPLQIRVEAGDVIVVAMGPDGQEHARIADLPSPPRSGHVAAGEDPESIRYPFDGFPYFFC